MDADGRTGKRQGMVGGITRNLPEVYSGNLPKLNRIPERTWGHTVAQLVEALRYKPEGRGFDSRWRHLNFSLTILPASPTLGSTQPLTEMSTRNISCEVKAAGA